MKITNMELVNMSNTIGKYIDKKLPQKISYAITKNYMKISTEYQVYDERLKTLFSSFEEHIKKDDKGNWKYHNNGVPIVDDEVADDFNKELSDLLNIVIDIDLYFIDESAFDYEDKDIYDALSAKDIIVLQSILCKRGD